MKIKVPHKDQMAEEIISAIGDGEMTLGDVYELYQYIEQPELFDLLDKYLRGRFATIAVIVIVAIFGSTYGYHKFIEPISSGVMNLVTWGLSTLGVIYILLYIANDQNVKSRARFLHGVQFERSGRRDSIQEYEDLLREYEKSI